MHITARSYLTSGIAALGVGAIALAPIQPLPDHAAPAQEKAVASLAVNLASTIDPITPWVDTFKTAFANIQTLGKLNAQNPFPLAKTIGANIQTYVAELQNGQGNLIPEQISNNVKTFFQAPWSPGKTFDIPYADGPAPLALGEYASNTVPANGGNDPAAVSNLISGLVVGEFFNGCDTDNTCTLKPLIPIVNFLNTPYSGQLVAVLGAVISPFLQLTKSFTAIGEFFKAGDVVGAINELINIPANMTNASLNGAGFLDLSGVVNAILPNSPLPNVGLRLGGLLNAMPMGGSLVPGADNPPTKWSVGIGLDSFAGGPAFSPDFAYGIPNGLLGANIGLGQFLATKMLVKPPAPGQAVAAASAVRAAAAVEAPAVANAPAPVEAPVAVAVEAPAADPAQAAPISAPAPVSPPKTEAASAPEPARAPAPSRGRAAATATAGENSAGQHDSSGSAPAKHRGSRGQ